MMHVKLPYCMHCKPRKRKQKEDIDICILTSALHTFNISLVVVFHLYLNTKTTRIPGTTRSYSKDNKHEQDLVTGGGRKREKKDPQMTPGQSYITTTEPDV